MVDPLLVSIAAALAGRTVAAAASGSTSALRSLLDIVKKKFDRDPQAADALRAAQAEPDHSERVETLGAALSQAAEDDPEFAKQLFSLWDRAAKQLHADRGGVVNEISGSVGGHVVQARDITGGVSFGGPPRPGG
jgi:hypothetical protein